MDPYPRRLLITGSRFWTDWSIPQYALAAEWYTYGPATILVSGNCPPRSNGVPGADRICEVIWEGWGGPVERYPANWKQYGKPAGYIRNVEMVALPGVYKCLAFSLNDSNGTANCMDEAQARNIPVSPFKLWSSAT